MARAPYVVPAGPDVLDVSLSGGASTASLPVGTAVTLTATINDTRYGEKNGTEPSQNIAGGEYYVDTLPGRKGPPQ